MAMIQPPADGEGSGPQDEAVAAAQATIDMLAKRKNATDDLSRPLFERLGGDTALEACIGLVYAKALQDPRTRAYFEKNQRKIDSIKKKMHQFLSGQFGGASKYDLDDLKMMHYQMNITDFQFDVMSELFHHTFEAVGAHPNAVKDAMRAIGQVRKAITTGCTVRMELARRSIEKGKDGLYRRLGEAEGIKTFMDRVYELVVNDHRLKTYFADKDVEKVKNSQLVWITEALGGPKTWQGKDLKEVHRDLGVNDYLFDCFIMNCQKALNGLGVEEDVMDEVLVSLEPARDGVLCRTSGLSATSKVVSGKTVLERLGGEMNLEAVIETIVKYFFSKDTSKMTHIKSKMVQLLTGMLGGPQLYPVNNLRPAHYGLNITDYQFDAVLENFQVAANIMEVEPAVMNDMVEVVRFTRSPITCGCTVRLEIARKKTESQGTEGLISILGGQEGVVSWVAKVYDRVLVDDRVKHFFQGSKLDAVMESQGKYFQQLFGASAGYRGRDLPEIHSTIQISDFHFDSFMESCREAFQAMGVDSETIDDCTVLMESLRLQIVNKELMNHDVKRALEMANQKPLYDRLGGENSLEKLIDLAYEKALQDDRLRSFFEKNKAKVTTIKKKMTQFIGGLIGGPVTYDAKDLLPAHYGMNITNFHFDVMLTILATTLLNDIGVEKALARELMSALQPVRSDVTKGFTVRGEVARKNVADGVDHLFGRMGGKDGLLKIIDSLYEILAEDARVKEFFGGGVLERIRDGQTTVLVELLGGPKVYQGRDLVAVHKTLGVTDYHFDAFLVDFHKALSGAGLDGDLIDAVIITLEPLRDTVLGRDPGESAVAQQMKQKNGKPVIERLGGDMNLETIVEGMYEKAQVDDRLKFFLDKGKQKVRQIKQKMYQLMCGALGGPTLYDLNKLKPAHYNMNITDYHFDAILACFADTCQEMDVDADTVDDACLVLNSVRSDITAGCTVRMELARRRSQVDGDDQLFTRLGGMEGVEDVVTRLYECVERDRRINNFFTGAKLQAIKRTQSDFIIKTLGGPTDYNGRSLEEIHAVLAITDFHLDVFFQLMARALRDCGHDVEMADIVGLITNVERAHTDLQQLRTKMASVTGKLEAIKQQVGPAAGGGEDGTTTINAYYVQSELRKARETLDRFMSIVRERAEKQDATSADDELLEAEATMEALRKKLKGNDDKSRPLIERLGGDTAIETCVKLAYAQAVKDSRTKAYFDKTKRKMDSTKKKMHQYLAGAFGGASTYDNDGLKAIHYQLNITDFHFDAFAEMFHRTFIATGAHANAVRDAMRVLAATRKDITTGCTVRMELARRSTEKGLDALYKRLGEADGIRDFVDRVYDLLIGDKRMVSYFEGKNLDGIKKAQLVYITALLGGPKAWQGRDLAEIHSGLGIDDYGFDCFTMNCEKALNAMGVDEDTIDEIVVTMEPLRDEVLNRRRGLRAETKMVDGQSILERIGGEMNLEAVVETMFSGCVVDPRVKYFFTKDPSKLSGIQIKFTQLLTGLLGGPKTYDYARLRPAHYNLNITDYQFDAVVENLQAVCGMMDLSDAVVADISEVISTLRSYITCGCTVRYEIARKKTEASG
ncbi:hypothetical protein FOZ63_006307, partial [Perkinsus olseni]